MLCRWQVQFSAMQSAPNFGKKKFISAGASVSGVTWKTISTPSMTIRSPVRRMLWVGGTRLTCPIDTVLPSPESTWPLASFGRVAPYM